MLMWEVYFHFISCTLVIGLFQCPTCSAIHNNLTVKIDSCLIRQKPLISYLQWGTNLKKIKFMFFLSRKGRILTMLAYSLDSRPSHLSTTGEEVVYICSVPTPTTSVGFEPAGRSVSCLYPLPQSRPFVPRSCDHNTGQVGIGASKEAEWFRWSFKSGTHDAPSST